MLAQLTARTDLETDTSFGKVLRRIDQVAQVAAQPVEFPDHQDIAGTQGLQAR